jgi:chromosome partitioning protein
MRTITFVTQKGGSGKTILATNCAVAAERSGLKTLVLDLDPQGSAEAWYLDREDELPKLAHVSGAELAKAVVEAELSGFDLVIIDTPGRDEPLTAFAIRIADFCVVPYQTTPADMKATPPTVATITRLSKLAAFVLTQAPPRGGRLREAEARLSILGIVCPVRIVSRNVYQNAHGIGLGGKSSTPTARLPRRSRHFGIESNARWNN